MTYHNPFELLQTFAGYGSEWNDFGEKSLRRTRRRVIAEADLEGTLRFNKLDLSKNEIAAILDELDNEERFENHRLIYETKLVLNFLTKGDAEIFDLEDEYDLYDYLTDFDLIAQPFAVQFNKLFAEAFKENDGWQIEQMNRFLIFVDDKHLHTCFKSVEKSLATLVKKYEALLSEVKNEDFDADDVETLPDEINEDIGSETLNALPDYFKLKRDRLAEAIDQIAVNLYNNYSETEIAFDLSEIADEINAEALTEKCVKHNKGVFKNDLAQIEFARRLKKIERVAAIAKELKEFTKDLNSRLVSSAKDNKFGNRLFIQTLKKQIQDILDFNEINNLSDEVEAIKDLRDSIALELKKLSVVSYNHASDLDFSLSLIEMALQINVSSTTYSVLLKSKNHLISKKPVIQYPLFDEQFRMESIISEAEKPKFNFGQSNNSGNTNKNASSGGSSNYRQTQSKTYNRKYDTTPSFSYEPSENKSEFQQILVKVIGAFVVVFAAILIYFNYSSGGKFSSLNAELKKMNSGAGFSVPSKTSEKLNQVKLKRRLLPINAKTKAVDEDFYNQMTPDIKADLLGEFNTFVSINCHSELGFISYNPLKSASIMTCDLVAFDKAQNAVVLKKTFEEKPVNTSRSSQSNAPEIPYKRMINYLIENSEK